MEGRLGSVSVQLSSDISGYCIDQLRQIAVVAEYQDRNQTKSEKGLGPLWIEFASQLTFDFICEQLQTLLKWKNTHLSSDLRIENGSYFVSCLRYRHEQCLLSLIILHIAYMETFLSNQRHICVHTSYIHYETDPRLAISEQGSKRGNCINTLRLSTCDGMAHCAKCEQTLRDVAG